MPVLAIFVGRRPSVSVMSTACGVMTVAGTTERSAWSRVSHLIICLSYLAIIPFLRNVTPRCELVGVNCEVSEWGRWSPCSKLCGKGSQSRTRSITREPANGGDQCPLLMETRSCNGHMCNHRRVGRSEYNSYRYMELPSGKSRTL